MATVPRYYRDKLISSRTGVGSMDTSKAEMARAVSDLAANFSQNVHQIEQKNKMLEQKTSQHKLASQFDLAYMEQAPQIKAANANSPERGNELLNKTAQEISQGLLATIEDGSVRQEMGYVFEASLSRLQVENKKWEMDMVAQKTQQNLMDTVELDIKQVSSIDATPTTLADLLAKWNDEGGEESQDVNLTSAVLGFGGVEGGRKFIQDTSDGLVRAYVVSRVQDGQVFEAMKLLEGPQISEYISSGVRENLQKDITAAFEGKEIRRAVSNGFRMLEGNIDLVKDIDLDDSVIILDEKLNDTFFTISGLEEKLLGASDVEKEGIRKEITMQKRRANIINAAREANLKQVQYKNEDDPVIGSQLTRELSELLKLTTDSKKRFTGAKTDVAGVQGIQGKLDDVLLFQEKLMKRYNENGDVSKTTLDNLNFLLEVAIERQGAEDVVKQGWFGGQKIKTSNFSRDFSENVLAPLNKVINSENFGAVVGSTLDDQWVFDYSQEYIRQIQLIPSDMLKQPGEARDAQLNLAKRRAFAAASNIPVVEVGQSLMINGMVFPVKEYDNETGMPMLVITRPDNE